MSADVTEPRDLGEISALETPGAEPIEKADKFIVTARSMRHGRLACYLWNNIDLSIGQMCVLEDKNGLDFGFVASPRRLCFDAKAAVGRVHRAATENDLARAREFEKKERAAKLYCQERIAARNLPMKLTRAHCTYDGLKMIFFFTADGRVDFRELIKDLTRHTRQKIEIRQIGIRDEAKMLGGCGRCGKEFCCSTFIHPFEPVSIKMAKTQCLALNPVKLSGACGRLMCCLAYENDQYKESSKRAPKPNRAIYDEDGRKAFSVQIDYLAESARLKFEDDSTRIVDFGNIRADSSGTYRIHAPPQEPSENLRRGDGDEGNSEGDQSDRSDGGSRFHFNRRRDSRRSNFAAMNRSKRNEKPDAPRSARRKDASRSHSPSERADESPEGSHASARKRRSRRVNRNSQGHDADRGENQN